jgi:hypothetical protein
LLINKKNPQDDRAVVCPKAKAKKVAILIISNLLRDISLAFDIRFFENQLPFC